MLAPILKIKNVTSQVAYDAKYSDQLKAFGNEHMVLSSTGNIFSASVVSQEMVGGAGGDHK